MEIDNHPLRLLRAYAAAQEASVSAAAAKRGGGGGGGSKQRQRAAAADPPASLLPPVARIINLRLDREGYLQNDEQQQGARAPGGAFNTRTVLPLALHEVSSRHSVKAAAFKSASDARYLNGLVVVQTPLGPSHRFLATGGAMPRGATRRENDGSEVPLPAALYARPRTPSEAGSAPPPPTC